MAINKIELNNDDGTKNVLLDLSSDTLSDPGEILSGVVGHLRDGTQVTGTLDPSGGGIAGVTELYSSDSLSITYTSTSAGTAKSITGITGIKTYPYVAVIIQNTDTTKGALKFVSSSTFIVNTQYESGGYSGTRYGSQLYYSSNQTLTSIASTSYGLWGYTISSTGALTIRGRCNGSYYTSLTGTYKIKVLGISIL